LGELVSQRFEGAAATEVFTKANMKTINKSSMERTGRSMPRVNRLEPVDGLVIFDDYQWAVNPDVMRHPDMVVDAFPARHAGEYKVISKEWRLILQKIKG
jgi:hypothetical protein